MQADNYPSLFTRTKVLGNTMAENLVTEDIWAGENGEAGESGEAGFVKVN